MLPSRPQAGADLAVHRARATGWRGTRAEVARWLEDVPIASLGLGPDELLYLPRLRVSVPVHQGHGSGRMPDRIIAELRALLAGADSGWGAGFSPDRAYRFTSQGRYFAWLVALLVKDGSAPAAQAFHAATGGLSLRQWQRAAVLPDGAAFVATVARLAEIGCAAQWIERFDPAEIALARRGIEQRFALRLEPAGDPPARPVSDGPPRRAAAAPPPLQLTIGKLAASGDDWRHLAPEAGKLLLAALVLARNPAQPPAQAALLVEAIARLCAPADTGPGTRAAAPPAPSTIAAPASATRQDAARPQPTSWPDHQVDEPPPAPADKAHRAKREAVTPARSVPSVPVSKAVGAQSDPVAAPGTADDLQPPEAHPAGFAHAAPQNPARRSTMVPFLAPDAQFTTEFGGLLFLLNAFIALGLYPDFTAPLGARLDPSPLWLVDRIGRYWFGAPYRRDPLAAWISGHAGPGRLPRAWRPEPDWLADFATRAAPRSTCRHGRVTTWHPAGFPLADERQGQRPRRALHGFRHPQIGRASLARRLPSDQSDRWAACLAHYLDARLRLLCGAGLSLLARAARVKIRDLDLTATFTLDRHPIGLRIAGLDRDPGWSPAEGRAIAFVFE